MLVVEEEREVEELEVPRDEIVNEAEAVVLPLVVLEENAVNEIEEEAVWHVVVVAEGEPEGEGLPENVRAPVAVAFGDRVEEDEPEMRDEAEGEDDAERRGLGDVVRVTLMVTVGDIVADCVEELVVLPAEVTVALLAAE